MESGFLPPDYEVPQSEGNYLKFKKPGDYQFRILSSPILGEELWIGKKPFRIKMGSQFSPEQVATADKNQDGSRQTPRHFWAMPVFYRGDNSVKILQINQSTIQVAIKKFLSDEDWANPKEYDFVVARLDGEKVSYSVRTKKPQDLEPDAIAAWKAIQKNGFNLEALYDGADPFQPLAERGIKELVQDEFGNNGEPLPPEEVDISPFDE